MIEVLIAFISACLGAIVGPWVQSWLERKKRDEWAAPRKELLLKVLNDPEKRFKTIDYLSRIIGSSEDDTRSLLIELGARGATLHNKKEGWALITRAPLKEDLRNIEENEAEE